MPYPKANPTQLFWVPWSATEGIGNSWEEGIIAAFLSEGINERSSVLIEGIRSSSASVEGINPVGLISDNVEGWTVLKVTALP